MKIFENYNTAKQKYGEELANSVLSNGIPNEYVYTACRYYTEDNIPIEVLQQKFRQWMSYVRNLGKETFNINNLSYQQFDNIIRDEIQKAMKPNPIYDDGTIFMGEFKTKEDALLYPIPNEWCTSNSSSKYNQYVGDGYRLFVIENKSLDEPLKYVCASVYNGRVIYWDVNDNQLYEDLRDYTNVNNSEHETYQRTLPKQIVDYLYNIAAEQTDEIENKQNINCNTNMNKKLIRLTENDLHKIVKESVNRVTKINEWGEMRYNVITKKFIAQGAAKIEQILNSIYQNAPDAREALENEEWYQQIRSGLIGMKNFGMTR